jgi:hypothetical protein
MTDEYITQQQLDSLERAADKVFSRLGIDIDFTRHFLDRVNDDRNGNQITIRELGQILAKEYKKWGRQISAMDIDAEAVMKDLSSELNIPFVLNKSGKGKALVAKTVMRKKQFHSPDPILTVEDNSPATNTQFVQSLRTQGWSIYVSNQNNAKLVEFEKDGIEFEITGKANRWELFMDGPTLSGSGELFTSLQDAFAASQNKITEDRSASTQESDVEYIEQRRAKSDWKKKHPGKAWPGYSKAREYTNIAEDYQLMLQKGAWECEQIRSNLKEGRMVDPREAILRKALAYLDAMIKSKGDLQTIGGYAFDIARSFDLTGIATARELAQLYNDWNSTNEGVSGSSEIGV